MIQMQTHRFFIGDLPAGTNEKDIRKAFKDHGEVTNVELKEKENLVEPGSVKVLAFVTLKLFDGDVDYCLKKLNSKQINGQYVRVSVAKESFMERLKREREENAQKSTKTEKHSSETREDVVQPFKKSKKFPDNDEEEDANPFKPQVNEFQSSSKSKKFFDSDNDEDEEKVSDDEDPVLIKKKKASNSIRNGRIVIESTNNTPIHVIGKQKEVKRLDEKSFTSDKKRKESVKKKKNQYQLQKSLIQQSLSSVDASKTKKIVFDNDSDNEDGEKTKSKALFDDASDQEDESLGAEFALKAEYEGSRGAELMKLQSKMSLDPRFKVDKKFVDHIDDEEPAKNENSERDWQYGILEQVTGNKVSSLSHPKANEKRLLKMVRYDPSKDNQEGLLRKSKKPDPQEKEEEETIEEVTDKREVSKEVFYVVSENLSNSLKTRGDGFSLLSMFGTATEEEKKTTGSESNEKILISKSDKNTMNPFTYDSSESENEEDRSTEKANNKAEKEVKGSGKETAKIFVESFFIPKNDIRLKEGKAFFKHKPSEKAENYDEIRDKLKNIIKTKINKTKRQFKGKITKKQRPIRRK